MSLRQTTASTTDDDLLAMPASMVAVFRRLNEQRAALIAVRTAAAEDRHEQRRTENGAALMYGGLSLRQYRAAYDASKDQRDAEIADTPPALDVELSRARVEARVREAKPSWWAEECVRAQAAQEAWAVAHVDSDAETVAERGQGAVYA
jgi:Tfp pilus assembly protein PilV